MFLCKFTLRRSIWLPVVFGLMTAAGCATRDDTADRPERRPTSPPAPDTQGPMSDDPWESSSYGDGVMLSGPEEAAAVEFDGEEQGRREALQAGDELPEVPEPSADAAEVPDGYRVEVVVSGLRYPTGVEFDDAGNMYVAEAGFVYGDPVAQPRVLRVDTGGEITVAAEDLSGPVNDLLWHDGQLYISHRSKISVLETDGAVRDLVTDLPSLGDHHNNQLAVGPGGEIFFGQGTATNSGVVGIDNFMMGWLVLHPDFHDVPANTITLRDRDFVTANPLELPPEGPAPTATTAPFHPFGEQGEPGEQVEGEVKAGGTILRMNASGEDLQVHAWGLRNPFGVAFDEGGRLFAAENGFDARGSRPIANAPDNLWEIEEGAWYGWPDFASGVPVTDPMFRPDEGPQPEFLMEEHPPVSEPLVTLPVHAGVTKIAFAPAEGEFGFGGDLFVAEFGDMTPLTGEAGEHAGHRVARVDLETGEVHPFFFTSEDALGEEGEEYLATAGPKRLLEPYFTREGDALYVTDIGAFTVVEGAQPMPMPFPGTGVVWRIVPEDVQPSGPPAGLIVPPEKP